MAQKIKKNEKEEQALKDKFDGTHEAILDRKEDQAIDDLFYKEEILNPNCGIHKNKLYFGFRDIIKGETRSYLIFEDGELVISDKYHRFDDIKFSNYMVSSKYSHSSSLIKQLRTPNASQDLTTELKIDLITILKTFIELEDEESYKMVACWIIHTYLLNLFSFTPYLYLCGDEASGKTSLMKVIAKLGFKGKLITSPSVASMRDIIAMNKPTLCLDEFDKFHEDIKKFAISILNAGNEQGGSVTIQEKDPLIKKFIPVERDVFCPKVFASNEEESINNFKSRCIKVIMLKTDKNLEDLNNLTDDQEQVFQETRDKLFLFVLKNHAEIMQNYEEARKQLKHTFKGRKLQIIRPLFCIAKLFGWEKDIIEFIKENQETSEVDRIETDRRYLILKNLYLAMPDNDSIRMMGSSEIASIINQDMGIETKEYKMTSRSLGRYMSFLQLNKYRYRTMDGSEYRLKKSQIESRLKRYGWLTFIKRR